MATVERLDYKWNLHNTDTIGTLPTVLIIDLSFVRRLVHSITSHTPQSVALTCRITEITQAANRRFKRGLTEREISICDVPDDPHGTDSLALAIAYGGMALTVCITEFIDYAI